MKILIRQGLGSGAKVIDDVTQVVVLNDFETPVSVSYTQMDKGVVISAHAADPDFKKHLSHVGKLVEGLKPTDVSVVRVG